MRRPDLAKIQRWMQEAIVAGEEPDAARTRRMVRPSATMAPEERLGVYRGMYLARLNEALRTDFPALAQFLGDELFDELVAIYVREHPSRSYTLNDLGAELPRFLDRLDGLPSPGYARDLARFELAQAHVFDEAETEAMSTEDVAAVPDAAWAGARLAPIAALRLLELDYPVQLYVEAMKREGPRPPRRRRRTRLVVFRRNYSVTWMELGKPAFGVLGELASGAPLGTALRLIRDDDTAFTMFQRWMTEGLFRTVTV